MDCSGIWIPLVTPFVTRFRGSAVDLPALARLVQHLAAQGVAGFVPCGSTGEAAMLSADEQQQVLATTLQAAAGLPVICGVAGVQPAQVAARITQLSEACPGVAAFLLAAPAYVKPSQAGIADFFEQVASAAPRPLVAYDVPSRTGVRIEVATLLALAAHPQIVAVKDCSGDRAAAEALLADGRLSLLAGNDDELFDQLARGAVGGITATAHLATADFVALQRAIAAGQLAPARALWRRLAPLARAAFAEPNPAPLKAALARQGWMAEVLRAPMQPASPATAQALLSRL
ncbi:MAG: 4-hydroxy-tetrahydrodipicolinate synthase [Rubrivivax sp.]